jgi:hypothetical protein
MNETARCSKKEIGLRHTGVEHSIKCNAVVTAKVTNGEVLKKIRCDNKNKQIKTVLNQQEDYFSYFRVPPNYLY